MNQSKKALIASIITAATLGSASTAVNADWWQDISMAGFASTVYRQSNDQVQWQPEVADPGDPATAPPTIAKFTNGIDDNGSFAGTNFGLNINAQVNDFVTLRSQFVAIQNESDYVLNLDWALASFQISDEVTVRTGKIIFPVGIVNEYVNVNFANPWISAPAVIYSPEQYGAQATREGYSGASLLYNVEAGEVYYDVDLFGGEIDLEDAKIKNMAGITARANWDDIVLFQGSYFNGTMHPEFSSPMRSMMEGRSTKNTMFSVKGDWNNVIFFYEHARVKMDAQMNGASSDIMDSTSWYGTLGYQMDNFLPHYTYQSLKQADGDENTVSTVGLRWDVASSVAVKFEVSQISSVVGNFGVYRGGLFGVQSDAAVGQPGGNLILPAKDVRMYGISVDVIF